MVVAGGGVAAGAAAIRLRRLGFGVHVFVRRGVGAAGIEALPQRALGLLEVLGEPDLVSTAGGFAVATGDGTSVLMHVDRQTLAETFVDRARALGAVVEEVRRLPPAGAVSPTAAAVIDATGRAAAWSRPVVVDSHDVAWQFEGPPQPDLALSVVHADGWWAYRLGTPSTLWAGVVMTTAPDAEAAPADIAGEGLRCLGLDPSEMKPRGRRAARVQRAVRPVAGRRIAVGDAALAHDPIAGGGIRFALASAVAAATTVGTWIDDPGRRDLAAAYYDEMVAGEHGRHLEARRAIHAGGGDTTFVEGSSGLDATPVPEVVWLTAAVVEAPLAIDGLVRPGPAVRLPDGTLTRWLGSFDLLVLARLATDPVPRIVLLARLQQEGLDVAGARRVLSWAMRHGLLTG